MLPRCESEGATTEHGGGLGLHVEITIKLIRAPTADEPDPIAVDASAEEGHGSAGPRGTGRDGAGRIGGIRIEDEGSTEVPSDVRGEDILERPARDAIGIKGCAGWGIGLAQRDGASHQG